VCVNTRAPARARSFARSLYHLLFQCNPNLIVMTMSFGDLSIENRNTYYFGAQGPCKLELLLAAQPGPSPHRYPHGAASPVLSSIVDQCRGWFFVWSFVVLFLSCDVWCCSCRVLVCETCFSSYRYCASQVSGGEEGEEEEEAVMEEGEEEEGEAGRRNKEKSRTKQPPEEWVGVGVEKVGKKERQWLKQKLEEEGGEAGEGGGRKREKLRLKQKNTLEGEEGEDESRQRERKKEKMRLEKNKHEEEEEEDDDDDEGGQKERNNEKMRLKQKQHQEEEDEGGREVERKQEKQRLLQKKPAALAQVRVQCLIRISPIYV